VHSLTTDTSAGIVRPGELLTLTAAKRALGVGAWGWREIAKIVPTVKVGRQRYILADDLIAEFRRLRDEQNSTDGGRLDG
jgi:hypothetical protein